MESKCVGVHVTIVLNKCAFVGFCLLLVNYSYFLDSTRCCCKDPGKYFIVCCIKIWNFQNEGGLLMRYTGTVVETLVRRGEGDSLFVLP